MDDDASRPSARIAAAVAILDRGRGKPRHAVEVTGNEGGPILTLDMAKLSTATLTEIVEQMAESSPRKRIEQRLTALDMVRTDT